MTDAKAQNFRSAPSGPVSGRKVTCAVGGTGTTILAAKNTNITLTSTTFPALAKVKKADMILVAPTGSTGPGGADVRPIAAWCATDGTVTVSFNNPTVANVTDFTSSVDLLIFPFNL
jgi:hypothetical protein